MREEKVKAQGHLGSDIIDNILSAARAHNGRPVFPEGHEPRILAAARMLVDEELAKPVILGDGAEINRAASSSGIALAGIDVIDPASSPELSGSSRNTSAKTSIAASSWSSKGAVHFANSSCSE